MNTYQVINTKEYEIVSVAFLDERPIHEALQEKVLELIERGMEPLGPPFFGPEALYQAMIRRRDV